MLQALFVLILIWVIWTVGTIIWTRTTLKRAATVLKSEEFEKQSRGQQLIDIREPAKFKAKHILGARNIQYAMLNENHTALRKDKPVFLYDENMQFAARLARKLKKDGYNEIFVLKNGFAEYNGKTKSN
ncbi:rhodanese-like domain-containing protein [Weissella cibaria]|uniref:rhodanese-like domain-containing protein n=1 Tax=Weissella cibaria TaxID=137591 RepID=UPI0021BE52C7|nr:rhodanese-like domain-containing protein [Weissella cibaria]MCT8398740.1 rhodanese-like domain-containing protein [Weissella cibaria]MCT8401906.1 rhodanese-like domain-containing protein [Weissella cibaria]